MWYFTRYNQSLTNRDGFAIVTFSWITTAVIGCLPFYLSGSIPNITDAFFESMSGVTTTGASILGNISTMPHLENGIESLPHGILFWRSFIQWIGGMGIIVLATIIFSRLFGGGIQVLQAEMPGTGVTRLKPQMAQTARLLWTLYFFLTLAEIILLYSAGLSFYDSICNSFSTVSTGGFSPKIDSIGSYNSVSVDFIVTFFMLISGVNFVILYYIFNHIKDNSKSIQSRFKNIYFLLKENEELKVYLFLIDLLKNLYLNNFFQLLYSLNHFPNFFSPK